LKHKVNNLWQPFCFVLLGFCFMCVCFVDRWLSLCSFSFCHCVVCSSSIYGFWLPLWYHKAPLGISLRQTTTLMKVPRVQTHISAQGLRGAPSIGCYYQVMTQKAWPWTIVGSMFLEDNSPHPDLVQAFLKKWWVESDFKAPFITAQRFRLSL
jgi:hypothetical protein